VIDGTLVRENPTAQIPRFCKVPEYLATYGPEVADLCERDADYGPDAQQKLVLDVLFAKKKGGQSAAFETGVVVGRQNLKSAAFKQASIGWLVLFKIPLVVYSAHEFLTAMEMFNGLEQIFLNSDTLRPQVRRVVRNHGEEGIIMMSGARILFKTRTKGGGRGLSAPKVIFDESYALKAAHMGALLPTLSAQPDPQLIYGSSAGLADSDALREIRDRGRDASDSDPRLAWLEWAAPDPREACDAGAGCTHSKNAVGCGCDKPGYWREANPSIGIRITSDYVKAERRALPVSEFMRERMGWWDDPLQGLAPVSMGEWTNVGDSKSVWYEGSNLAVGIEIAPDSSMTSIAMAGWTRSQAEDIDIAHVDLVEYLPGTDWVLEFLLGLVRRRKPVCVTINPGSPAGAFEKKLRNGLKLANEPDSKAIKFVTIPKNDEKPLMLHTDQQLMQLPSTQEWAQACVDFAHDVKDNRFRHSDQSPANQAVEVARSRQMSGNLWVWDTESGYDISPLRAMTLAKLGLETHGRKKPLEPFFLV
jgi:hypothetical protein